ncbi:hypothetical protein Leryth_027093 [Lithospermum erythrorhizon]|nr:hypothetical protein Leryth_027093 [Lithospermum erythrorhizon]
MLISSCHISRFPQVDGIIGPSTKKWRSCFSYSFSFSLDRVGVLLSRRRNQFFASIWLFPILFFINCRRGEPNSTCSVSFIETKMKGISKGFNKYITNIFVVKEERDANWLSDRCKACVTYCFDSFLCEAFFHFIFKSIYSDNMGQQSTEAPPKPKKLRRKKKKSSTTSSPRAGGVKIKTSRKSKSEVN